MAMDAIKKKMQSMRLEKDNALDRADAAEEKAKQMQDRVERVILWAIISDFYK